MQPPPQPTASGDSARCIPITSAERARCYLTATGGVAPGEGGLRNLILANSFLGNRGTVRNLANQFLERYPDSRSAPQIRRMAQGQ